MRLPFSKTPGHALTTTPLRWRSVDGIHIGFNGQVWLYGQLDLTPLSWEDPASKIAKQANLKGVLDAVGQASHTSTSIKQLSSLRQIHLLALSWDSTGKPSPKTPEPLYSVQQQLMNFSVPAKAVVLGVKLRSSVVAKAANSAHPLRDVVDALKTSSIAALGQAVVDLDPYEEDFKRIQAIFVANRVKRLTPEVAAQMDSWYNKGQGSDVEVLVAKDAIFVDGVYNKIEMAAIKAFDTEVMQSPHSQWALDAMTSSSPASVISVRGQIEPSTMAKKRVRQVRRSILGQAKEDAKSGDIEDSDAQMHYDLTKELEDFIAVTQEPLISKCSIVLGRRSDNADFTYIDELKNVHGIEVIPLTYRQLEAVDETLPCSGNTSHPYLQDVNIAMLAYAGFQGFSALGDPPSRNTVFTGVVDPDQTICMLDMKRAATIENKSSAMAIFGDPGSGKTFLSQFIAFQSALMGEQVIFINPKADSDLTPFANYVRSYGVEAEVIRTSEIEETPGFFDPFRYTDPDRAIELLNYYILSVLDEFTQEQELTLSSTLRDAATSGVIFCANDAISFLGTRDKYLETLVRKQITASRLFSLAFGNADQKPYNGTGGLTLIEFNHKLPLPNKVPGERTHRDERVALAVLRLAVTASLEILKRSRGGVFILDEAWTFLSSSQGIATVQELGRENRSRNIFPIFATQRVDDLLNQGVDMEGFLSRVFVGNLSNPKEARAGLIFAGLEPTNARINFLKNAGVQPPSGDYPGRPPMFLHRDIQGNHAAVSIAPIPKDMLVSFSTTPKDNSTPEETDPILDMFNSNV